MSSCLYPCPCGYWGDPTAPRNCSCSPTIVTRYQKRISGPLRVDYEKLASDRASESSEVVRQCVRSACEKQLARFDGSGLTCNADTPALPQMTETSCAAGGCERCKCGPGAHPESCELDDTSKALMRSAMNQLGMSARAFHRVLKLARTIADLAGAEQVQAAHLAEAIHLRSTETAGVRHK